MCNSSLLTKIIYQNKEIKKEENFNFFYYINIILSFYD